MFNFDQRDNILFSSMFGEEGSFFPAFEEVTDELMSQESSLEMVPILPLRNMILFPGVMLPVAIGRKRTLKAVKEAYKKGGFIGVFCQKDGQVDEPEFDDLFNFGAFAQVKKILEGPDGNTTVFLQARNRIRLKSIVKTDPYLVGQIEPATEKFDLVAGTESEAVVAAVRDLATKFINAYTSGAIDGNSVIQTSGNPSYLVNSISTNMPFPIVDKGILIEFTSIRDRAYKLLELLARETQFQELKNDIQSKTRVEIDQQQREYFLHNQIKTIQDELGGSPVEKEIVEMKEKAAKKVWSKEVEEVFVKELMKLERMNPAAADYGVQVNYLSTFVDLPWNEYTVDNFDLKHAQKVFDEDHYGLEKVKERILEYLAVLKLKGDLKSPILCLVGPPGVGKTSLGKSIARALDRKYVRMSLGGLHDEAEIRGHRKTYIGAMPGRILQNLKKVGSSNPVFILDEIDKVTSDFRGDPSSALLEVLDPEQNFAFHDNFLEIDYDLSKVMFVATANSLASIAGPLLDRMEVIDVSGYLTEEKVEIANRHLVPRQLENHGLKKSVMKFGKGTIETIIEQYTRESGVRSLDKKIAKVMRRIAMKVATGDIISAKVTPKDLKELLGVPRYTRDEYQGNEFAGVVTGLAWTSVGGEILFVETSLSKGKGERLSLTGNLGDVMKESAIIALEYIKSHAVKLGVDASVLDHYNVHVHVPEGAIPKDGPSAGVTMVTSLVSALRQCKVRAGIAMTGEITLRGKVLPVGGIKEKILAAKRAGITEIVLSADNRKDVEEIKDLYVKGLVFHYVETILDVVKYAILDERVNDAIEFEKPVKVVS